MFKKSLLSLMMLCFAFFGVARAQSELTIYEDGTATNSYVPVYGLWADAYQKCEFVVPADELSDMNGGTISQMSFYLSSPATAAWTGTFQVFLMEVAETSISAFYGPDDATVVYEGTLDATASPMSVVFSENYTYAGGNLLVGVYEIANGNYKSATFQGETVEGACVQGYSSSGLSGVSPTQRNFIPTTKFTYTPGSGPVCERPASLVASDVTAHGATLTWESEVGNYSFEYKLASEEEWTALPLDVNTYTLTGLNQNTAYNTRVKAICGEGLESGYKTANFTTLVACPNPTNLTVTLTPGNGTIANLAWTENGTTTEWDIEYGRDVNFEDFQVANASGTPSYLLEGLTPELKYYARVKAYCGDEGYSTYSNVVTFTPTDAYTLTVNDGTTTNGYVPVYGYWADQHSKSQFIIPAADLADMQWGTISKLTFYASNSNVSWGSAAFEVYVAEVGYTTFEEATLVDWASMEKVMNAGSLAISGNKMEVVLDAPYQYMGGNLMIGILETTSGSYSSCSWYGVTQEGNTAIGGYENSKGLSLIQFLPKTTFDYEPGEAPACVKPTQLAVNYVEGTTATVSWVSDATAWNIDVNGTVTAITENPYTLTDLELNTNYEVMVQAICDNGDSEWAGPVSFTTDACMPEDMIVVNYELTDSWGDGWNDNYILVVDENCNIVEMLTIASGYSATGTVRVCGSLAQFMWYMGTYPDETSWVFTNADGDVLFEGAGNTDMASYDVLYTIDLNPYAMPADVEVLEVGPYTAKLGWTETGTATAWQIGFFDEEGELVNTVDATTNPFTLTGLTGATTYNVNVRATGVNGTSLWPCLGYTTFTTLEACAAPAALDLTLTPFSAIVDWTDYEGAYDLEWAEIPAAKDGGLMLQYDDNTWYTNIGSTTAGWRSWGVKYPADMLQGNKVLTTIALQENTNFVVDSVYTISIYNGDAIAPTTLVATQNVTPGGVAAMREITLDSPVNINPYQSLWITVRAYGTYIMTACQVNNPDNQWWDNNNDGVWTNMGEDNANLAGYGWMIRGYVEGYDPADFDWNPVTGITPPYTLEDLSENTYYVVRVKAACGTEWKWAYFTTPSACDAPLELEATDLTYNSATLNWMGYQSSYNVQYREAAHRETYYFTNMNTDEDREGWDWEGYVIYGFADPIYGYNSNDNYFLQMGWSTTDTTYIFSPELPEYGSGSVVEFYHFGYTVANTFQVGYSSTSNDTIAFTWSDPIDAEFDYTLYSEVLPEGTKYVAFRAVASSQSACVFIDNFGIYGPTVAAGEWIAATATDPTLALNGLTPDTEYEWQVQGVNPNCDGGLTEWSEMATFTTLPHLNALTAGWNWWSTDLEITLDDLKAALVEALPGATEIKIQSQSNGNTTYNGTRWRGGLNSLNLSQMYLIQVPEDCEIELEGAYIDPAEHPVTIHNGANWIAFPLSESMSLGNAFAGFALNGDKIQSQANGNSTYTNRWRGQLTTLVPGQGYIYSSEQTDDRTLTFPNGASKAAPTLVQKAKAERILLPGESLRTSEMF